VPCPSPYAPLFVHSRHHYSQSYRKEDHQTYPIMTLIAPNGVTRMAGAKVYAAKLATVISVYSFSLPRPRLSLRSVFDGFLSCKSRFGSISSVSLRGSRTVYLKHIFDAVTACDMSLVPHSPEQDDEIEMRTGPTFSNNHYHQLDPGPGHRDSLVTIPAHQIGFRKYAKSSASCQLCHPLPCFFVSPGRAR